MYWAPALYILPEAIAVTLGPRIEKTGKNPVKKKNEIKIVIGDEWSAGNLSYHLYSRPIWINDLKNKTSNITEDQGVIYTGNPKILKKTAEDINKEIIQSKKIFGELLPKGDLKNFILNNVKTYMRKSFAVFTNPEYMPDKKITQGATKWILENVVKKNKDLRESAKTLKTSKMTDAQAQNAFAESLMNKILILLAQINYYNNTVAINL